MPNQRGADQKLINVPMSENFKDTMDRSVRKAGYEDRSKFIRDAICEKLAREGFEVPSMEDRLPPSRVGKGGRPKSLDDAEHTVVEDSDHKTPVRYRIDKSITGPDAMQETKTAGANSTVGSALKRGGDDDVSKARREAQARARKPKAGAPSGNKSGRGRGGRRG